MQVGYYWLPGVRGIFIRPMSGMYVLHAQSVNRRFKNITFNRLNINISEN
jgi:hypothetical protein